MVIPPEEYSFNKSIGGNWYRDNSNVGQIHQNLVPIWKLNFLLQLLLLQLFQLQNHLL